jgi:hypothetical protein
MLDGVCQPQGQHTPVDINTVVGGDEEMKGGGDEVGKGGSSEESGGTDWVSAKAKRQKVMKRKEKKKARKARLKAMAVKGQGKVQVVEDGSGEDSVGSDGQRRSDGRSDDDWAEMEEQMLMEEMMMGGGSMMDLDRHDLTRAYHAHLFQHDGRTSTSTSTSTDFSNSRRRATSLLSPFLSSPPLPQ